ncbi:MAG: MFS transporter [Euryarchaeota archaeon]|nr:MFS transporter [Euryarchaeota archaeon]
MQSLRRTVAVLSGTVFLVMIGIAIIIPALPQYGLHLGATAFLAGVLVGALPTARVFLDLPAGALGDRFGNRRMMMTGLALIAITSAIAVVAFNYWVLLAVRVAEGIGSAFYVTSSLAALAKAAPPERRGRYMGLYVNALLIGQIVGPVLGGIVVLAWGIRSPFAAYALLACVGMMLITFGFEPEPGRTTGGRVDMAAVRRLLSDRSYVLVNVGTMGAFFLRAGLISTVIPLFIHFNWGVSETLAITFTGVLITTNAFATLLTLYPSGLIADRVGRKLPFVTSLVLAGIISPFLFFTRDLSSAIPVMFVYGLVLGLHGPLAAWTTDLTPREVMGTSMGLYRTLGDLGFLLGPVLLAAILELTMVAGRVTIYPFMVAAAFVTIAGLLMLLARDPVGEQRRASARATGDATQAAK